MTDFQRAVLKMLGPSTAARTVFSLASEHYNEVYPNRGQRAAVARALLDLHRDGKVASWIEQDSLGRMRKTYWWRKRP